MMRRAHGREEVKTTVVVALAVGLVVRGRRQSGLWAKLSFCVGFVVGMATAMARSDGGEGNRR